jgi:hypothetical protein
MIPISVCIITKNEAENLEKCLSALQPYPFEIVVVDTGSTDHSKEVAAKYTDRIYDFAWCDDFSAARAFSISKASHNMILVLDTDEFVTEIDLQEMERLIEENPKSIGLAKRLDYFDGGGVRRAQIYWVDRLFNRKYYHYENPVHECLFANDGITYQTYQSSITMDHVGYLGSKENLAAKSMRDIRLLLKAAETDQDNPYIYFQIGQCYMMMRDAENSLKYFQMAMDKNPPIDKDYTRILVKNYGEVLLTADRCEDALGLLSYYDAYQNNADYLCLIGTTYMQLNQPLKALPEFIKALTAPESDSLDAKNAIPSYYIGHIYQCFGQYDIAKTHYEHCGDYPPALERLKALENLRSSQT